MSGIAGIIRFDGAPVDPGAVVAMTASMAYRGPDGIKHWRSGPVALGQCMLRTTPESLEETQPLASEDASLVLVMDGRVDNWEELRRELLARGAVLRNRSDAELVLKAYQVWGRDCLPHIDGDFAFVIWDARRQRAFCARDRMGIKPINYHWDGKTFSFASDLQPLFALPWIKREPNEGVLSEFLAAQWHTRDETLWRGIMRLVAAHRMEVDGGGLRLDQYWEPDLWARLTYTKDGEFIERYRELLTDSARRLSRSHRPVAVEVSGGLDSSAIFCLAEHLRRSHLLPAPGVQGYTLNFSGDPRADELAYARAVGKHLGLRIEEIPPSMLPLGWFAERAGSGGDFPGFANGTMAQHLLQQASASGSCAILSGAGGDEWLEGSPAYYEEELMQGNWSTLSDCFGHDRSAFGVLHALKLLARHGFYPLTPLVFQTASRRIYRGLTGGRKFDEHYWLSPHMRELIRSRRRPGSEPQVRVAGQRELNATWRDVYRAIAIQEADRFYAATGVEVRYPFLTTELVQFAFSTPERLRLRGDRHKYIHVQAMRGFMPQAVLQRKDKAEFSLVVRRHLDQMQELLTETLPRERPEWLSRGGMARLFRAYQDDPQAGWPLWILWGVFGCDKVLA